MYLTKVSIFNWINIFINARVYNDKVTFIIIHHKKPTFLKQTFGLAFEGQPFLLSSRT